MSLDCRIRVLPDTVVKKIAAGEVVERPASVVKELVENAVDAGASHITVTIEEGGRQLIEITDDGGGMSAQELRLAVTPHATSKLAREEDLYAVTTMGFRGEALASISAISKLRIVSRRPDSVEGHEVRVVGERLESSRAAASPLGTTVSVRDLFFNVPVRRKFLRTNATETGHIHEQFARLALVHPPVAFQLTTNGRLKQNLPAGQSRPERIAKLYGPELVSALIPIRRDERGVVLEAYAAPPAQSKATARWQYTFVNGRYIRDRYVQHAIKEAYRGLTEPHRHGVVFLFLTLDPRRVDVNVHPTKIEVRWADPNLIHSQVLSALRETFQRRDLAPGLRTGGTVSSVDPAYQHRVREEMAAVLKATAPSPRSGPGGGGTPSMPTPRSVSRPGAGPEAQRTWPSLYGSPDAGAGSTGLSSAVGAHGDQNLDRAAAVPQPLPDVCDTDPQAQRGWDAYPPRAIQMHNLYLVAETEDGIVIVDQHALHERILYEQLREHLTAGPLESQRLLLPETLKLTPDEAALLETHGRLLTQLGIEMTPFGTDAVAVHAFPLVLKDTDVVSFMRDLLDFLAEQVANPQADVVLNHVLSLTACKAAVKAGDRLTPQEIDALFAQRDLIDKPSSCPHGRPTMLRLTRADLDRQFHRT